MIRSCFRGLIATLALVVLAGCSNPETPQEVAAAFWQAMAENDASDVVEYSTLADSAAFDGYKRSWTDAVPSFGRVIIEGREATIVTRLPAEAGTEGERLELITYLVRFNDQWLVDYDRTGDAILNPSPLSNIMGELTKLGQKLSDSFSSSSGQMEQQMDQLARDLDRQADELDEPTMEALANASRTVAETGERFTRLSDETLNRYREEWELKLAEMRADASAFIEELRP